MNALARELPRLLVLLSFLGFGVVSLFHPTASLSVLPDYAEFPTYVMFIGSSVMLFLGTLYGWFRTYIAGHLVLIVSLVTVGGVVEASSQSPVALLLFGYAAAIIASLQRVALDRRLYIDLKQTESVVLPEDET